VDSERVFGGDPILLPARSDDREHDANSGCGAGA
jgi:hypothetical protein